MNIRVNGEEVDARHATNVTELVERFGLAPDAVLIEHNGLALYRREWPGRTIAEGDRVEIVNVVAGG